MIRLVTVTALLLAALSTGCPGPARTSQTAASSPTAAAPAPSAKKQKTGKELYSASCAACHGPEGKGVQGVGKDLVASQFVRGQTDADLVAFIKKGRDTSDPLNTTKIPMPPKGGNPALTDADLNAIVSHIRALAGGASK